jgi:hypothetical protein
MQDHLRFTKDLIRLRRRSPRRAGAGYVHEGSIEAMKTAIEKLPHDGFALA